MKLSINKAKNNPLLYTFIALIAIALIITISVMTARIKKEQSTQQELQEQQAMSESIANIAKSGPKYKDIPAEDQTAKQEFIEAGAANYGISPEKDVTPQLITNTCIHNATAEITQNAKSVEAYKRNIEQIKSDVRKVREACYEKYSDVAYTEPEKPQSHLNSDTFLPNNQH